MPMKDYARPVKITVLIALQMVVQLVKQNTIAKKANAAAVIKIFKIAISVQTKILVQAVWTTRITSKQDSAQLVAIFMLSVRHAKQKTNASHAQMPPSLLMRVNVHSVAPSMLNASHVKLRDSASHAQIHILLTMGSAKFVVTF
jgi:hypothetical protein